MIDEARAILGLLSLPSGVVTGILLTLAWRSINANQARISRKNIRMALWASIAATLVMVVLAGAMTPLAVRALDPAGRLESVLVVYWVVYVIAIGILVVAVYTLVRAVGEARR